MLSNDKDSSQQHNFRDQEWGSKRVRFQTGVECAEKAKKIYSVP